MIRNAGERNHAEVTAEVRACKRLWASVVRTAADDLQTGLKTWDDTKRYYMGTAASAAQWFASEDDGIGTFLWCCDILDLNAQAVRRAIANGEAGNSHGRYATLLKLYNETRDDDADQTPDQEV